MWHSNRLRLHEIRAVFRLLDEAMELEAEPYAARRHLTSGLCQLIDAHQSFYVQFEGFEPGRTVSVLQMVVGGWPEQQMVESLQQWGRRNMLREDPLVDLGTYLPGPCVARRRCEIVTDTDWQGSGAFEAIAHPNRLGDIITSFFRHRPPDQVSGFAIHRLARQPAFTVRERRLVQLFILEAHRRYRRGDFDAHPDASPLVPTLSPRQRQVLEGLLRGASVKELAFDQQLSPRTAEEHVKAVYGKFGVTTRHELMAKFARA